MSNHDLQQCLFCDVSAETVEFQLMGCPCCGRRQEDE
jgi:hypothetical protein